MLVHSGTVQVLGEQVGAVLGPQDLDALQLGLQLLLLQPENPSVDVSRFAEATLVCQGESCRSVSVKSNPTVPFRDVC